MSYIDVKAMSLLAGKARAMEFVFTFEAGETLRPSESKLARESGSESGVHDPVIPAMSTAIN